MGCASSSYNRGTRNPVVVAPASHDRTPTLQDSPPGGVDRKEFVFSVPKLVSDRFWPTVVVPLAAIMELEALLIYEECLEQQVSVEMPNEASMVFVSHQWLAFKEPDPNRVQLRSFQHAFRKLLGDRCEASFEEGGWDVLTKGNPVHSRGLPDEAGTQVQLDVEFTAELLQKTLADSFVWWDYHSIPQADKTNQLKAIRSISSYIERATFFIVLAPSTRHRDTQMTCDYESWRRRGWCRLEQWANVLSVKYMNPLVISGRETISVISFTDFMFFVGFSRDGGAVGCGDFTCCMTGHEEGHICDKTLCLDVLWKMYKAKLDDRKGDYMSHAILTWTETSMMATAVDEPYKARLHGTSLEEPIDDQCLCRFKAAYSCSEDEQAFFRAVWIGDENLVKAMTDRGWGDVDTIVGRAGQPITPLYASSHSGNTHLIHTLLERPCCSRELVDTGCGVAKVTPLMRAAEIGHLAVVKLLLQRSANLESQRIDNGRTALHCTAANGHFSVFAALVDARADIDTTDKMGRTALHICMASSCLYGWPSGQAKIAQLLLTKRSSLDVQDRDGITPLRLWCENDTSALDALIISV